MTIKTFLERYSHCPCDSEDVYVAALRVPELKEYAKDYFKALEALEEKLEEIGFEYG